MPNGYPNNHRSSIVDPSAMLFICMTVIFLFITSLGYYHYHARLCVSRFYAPLVAPLRLLALRSSPRRGRATLGQLGCLVLLRAVPAPRVPPCEAPPRQCWYNGPRGVSSVGCPAALGWLAAEAMQVGVGTDFPGKPGLDSNTCQRYVVGPRRNVRVVSTRVKLQTEI